MAFDTDILIVGAGPVGLFLANECARRGLRWRLVETRTSQSTESRALAIFPRTLEIFDMAGVVAPFLELANRVTSVALTAHDRTLAHIRFEPEESPYPFVAVIPQSVTERLLARALQCAGGRIHYGTTFVTAVQEPDHVRATLENRAGVRSELTAAFVVGCDGPHSAVRQVLQVPLAGREYPDVFMLADIDTIEPLPPNQLWLCPSELGPVAIFPMSATRHRIVATIARPEGDAPTLELVRTILAKRAPQGIEARVMHWSSYFHIHHRHAARLRVGRMFIAGDAAHLHSPFGGQGMNTGLQDVWNLIWKLDLFLHDRGNEALLDSYQAERLPVIRQVLQTTDRLTRIMSTPSRVAQAVRDLVIPVAARWPALRHAFIERLAELDIGYRGSPIIEGSGKRYFDDSLRGGSGIGRRFLIVLDSDREAPTREAAAQLCGAFSDTVELRQSTHPGVELVRPDGYIAYSARGDDRAAALTSMYALLARQTRRSARAA